MSGSQSERPPRKADNYRHLAKQAGLRYVTDSRPGISRRRAGRGFVYRRPGSKPVSTADHGRIQSLVIPPAWQEVWICPFHDGHLQATGLDRRSRKQYRYHPQWREIVNSAKFDRLVEIAHVLPRVRRRIAKQLREPGLSKQRVCAVICRLLDRTAVRVGSHEYLRDNETHGLTTLLDHQVEVTGSKIRFSFRGKSGVDHEVSIVDRIAAPLIQQCRAIHGEFIFQYKSEDGFKLVTATDVNAYLAEISAGVMTAKDFRTWRGTVHAAALLAQVEIVASERASKKALRDVLRQTAALLGNTVTVCRSYYVHSGVIQSYLTGRYSEIVKSCPKGRCRSLTREEHLTIHVMSSLSNR